MSGRKIGFVASAFDCLHAGHISMLQEAAANCDFLIAGLHVDPSKERITKEPPLQSLLERQIQLSAVKYIDQIFVYETEDGLLDLLKCIKIDVRFLGEEYRGQCFTGMHLSIPIHYNARQHHWSSTRQREVLRRNMNGENG